MASTAGAAVRRLEVVAEAGRPTDVKLRPVFASGLPGPSYGQKTNLTSGDLDCSLDAGWVWADSLSFDEILPDFRLLAFLFLTQKLLFRAMSFFAGF